MHEYITTLTLFGIGLLAGLSFSHAVARRIDTITARGIAFALGILLPGVLYSIYSQ